MLLAFFFLLAPLQVTWKMTGEIHAKGIVFFGSKKLHSLAEQHGRCQAAAHALKAKLNHGSADNRTSLSEPQEGR